MWMHCEGTGSHILKVDEHGITGLSIENWSKGSVPFRYLDLSGVGVIGVLLVDGFLILPADPVGSVEEKLTFMAEKEMESYK